MIRIPMTAAVLAALASAAHAAPSDSLLAPVAGGLSDRLAPLGTFLETLPTDFRSNLASQLDQARTQTHELVDRIVDEGGLNDFLEAMSEEGEAENQLAKELASADPEAARSVLHSRVERQLADFGRTIQRGLTDEDPARLKASFDLAMKDLAREENTLMQTLETEGPAAPAASDLGLDHEELDEPAANGSPAAPESMGPAAPEGRRGHGRRGGGHGQGMRNGGHGQGMRNGGHGHGMRNGGHGRRGGGGHQRVNRHVQRQVNHQIQHQIQHRVQHQVQHQVRRQVRRQVRHAQRHAQQNHLAMQMRRQRRRVARQQMAFRRQQDMLRAQNRAYAQASRSAWLNAQAQASAWNARSLGYPTYNYRPGYQRRYSRPFPTGYYYRPDRVERVVRRGLWGVATVAATPFALLASLF